MAGPHWKNNDALAHYVMARAFNSEDGVMVYKHAAGVICVATLSSSNARRVRNARQGSIIGVYTKESDIRHVKEDLDEFGKELRLQ